MLLPSLGWAEEGIAWRSSQPPWRATPTVTSAITTVDYHADWLGVINPAWEEPFESLTIDPVLLPLGEYLTSPLEEEDLPLEPVEEPKASLGPVRPMTLRPIEPEFQLKLPESAEAEPEKEEPMRLPPPSERLHVMPREVETAPKELILPPELIPAPPAQILPPSPMPERKASLGCPSPNRLIGRTSNNTAVQVVSETTAHFGAPGLWHL